MAISGFNAGSNASYFFVIKPAAPPFNGLFDSNPGALNVFRNISSNFDWWNGSPVIPLGLAANTAYLLNVETALSPSRVMNYYRNGSFVQTASSASTIAVTWGSVPRIGSVNTGTFYYYGYIGEIIIYSKVLNANERVSITNYLREKWGI